MTLSRLFLFLALAVLSYASWPAGATDRVVNVAHVQWRDDGGTTHGAASNTVQTAIVADPGASISIWTPAPGSSILLLQRAATCVSGRAALSATAALDTLVSAAAQPLASTAIRPITTVRAGETLVFKLTAPLANKDPAVVDTVTTDIVTSSGDRETVKIYETGPNTGDFVGSIATRATPPALIRGDCVLSLTKGDTISIVCKRQNTEIPIAAVNVDVLVDPYGFVFDSGDGSPVTGARVTLIDDATGTPAQVFAPDGAARWPSTVTSGGAVTDSAGLVTTLGAGSYRFPLVAPGRYRLVIVAPAPYTAPSTATLADLAGLTRPGGTPVLVTTGSHGEPFLVGPSDAVGIDVPLDRPTAPVLLTKTASRVTASPGDVVLYKVGVTNPDSAHARRNVIVTDVAPPAMRVRPGTVRLDGKASPDLTVAADGRTIIGKLQLIPAGGVRVLSYALEVRSDAKSGQAINHVTAVDTRGPAARGSAAVRIDRETISARLTVLGRVVEGPCTTSTVLTPGLAGVRVLLEDGSYAVTDRDGRYHLDGLIPGRHVVAVDADSLPAGARMIDCARSTRSAGNAATRLVDGGGGALVSAEFHVVRAPVTSPASPAVALPAAPFVGPIPDQAAPEPKADKVAAGGERDWFQGGGASIAWLFPEPDHNPRAPAVRIAIRHLIGQKIVLSADGHRVDRIGFDGTRPDPTERFAVSLWRGVPLHDGLNRFHAEVTGADGAVVARLDREVRFVTTAARVEYLPDRSRLLADGIHRAMLAVRLLDRSGHPVHAGTTGQIALAPPYEAAQAIDADQARLLSGLERAQPTWRVRGDDGIAYVELAPTMVSGLVQLDFQFRDHDQMRRQRVEAWLSPGERPWTVVGLAEARLGRHLEPLDRSLDASGTAGPIADGRVAFYARGRVKGSWLLTLSYDSAKRRTDQRLGGEIDPNTYYTVYADRSSERRYDAATTRKLYIRLERRQFYALWGDFQTNFVNTELGRYVHAGTGFKAEAHGRKLAAQAFAAQFPTSHRRDEMQGNGLSATYALGARDVLANSETVTIEVRDRLRSELILDRRQLTRFIDYDLDYLAGTIRFSSPVLSRTTALDPQFIVVEYDIAQSAAGAVSGGARAAWTGAGERVRIGATALHDAGDRGRTTLGSADLRLRLGQTTELRAEAGASSRDGTRDLAWLVEAEHHDERIDVLAYARQIGRSYGAEQQNLAERGRRKLGLDGRVRLTDAVSLTGSGWIDDDLTSAARRIALRARIEYKSALTTWRLGVTHAEDQTDAVKSAASTLLEAGATRRLFDNRLELDGITGLAIGPAASIDFPVQHRLGARFQLTPEVSLVGAYELAHGQHLDAQTVRLGFEVKPWTGARISSALADQAIPEYGRRAFAAYGLAQSLQLGSHWSVDATLDGTHTLHGIDAARVVNPAQPVAAGGQLGGGGTITEDFTATTLGATYRALAWSGTARAEYRLGQLGDRAALTTGLIRRLGEGSALGVLGTWTQASVRGGATTAAIDLSASGAFRPAVSPFAMLGKLSFRADDVTGAIAGAVAPVIGTPLNVTGDARSRRLVGSLSLDYAPHGTDGHGGYQRSEMSLFLGARYVFDRIDGIDVAGLSTLVGLDARYGIGEHIELGLSGTVRGRIGAGVFAYAVGPSLGINPGKDMLLTLGWNVRGFADRDFAADRTTIQGPYTSFVLKFDRDSFAWLGLHRR